MMTRCIELSRDGVAAGELPFGSVIARGDEILSQSTNRVVRDGDLSRHAEIVAIAQGLSRAGRHGLRDCTLYSTVEPCPMCCFCIREGGHWSRGICS
jgi:tRNA(adenine34) deaminase